MAGPIGDGGCSIDACGIGIEPSTGPDGWPELNSADILNNYLIQKATRNDCNGGSLCSNF